MEWDEYIRGETPSVPIRETQKVTFYTAKGLYVKIDGEKVLVDSVSVHIPREFVYTAGHLGDPSIPVQVPTNTILDIYLSEKAKESFSSFEFNGEKHAIKVVTAIDTRRGREIIFCLEDGTRVQMVRREEVGGSPK